MKTSTNLYGHGKIIKTFDKKEKMPTAIMDSIKHDKYDEADENVFIRRVETEQQNTIQKLENHNAKPIKKTKLIHFFTAQYLITEHKRPARQ